jgi:hypothetical protein
MGITFGTNGLLGFQRTKLVSDRNIYALLGTEIDRNGGSNVSKLVKIYITSRSDFEIRPDFLISFEDFKFGA